MAAGCAASQTKSIVGRIFDRIKEVINKARFCADDEPRWMCGRCDLAEIDFTQLTNRLFTGKTFPHIAI